MQGEEFLCSPLFLEAQLTSFLLPGLFDELQAAETGTEIPVPERFCQVHRGAG